VSFEGDKIMNARHIVAGVVVAVFLGACSASADLLLDGVRDAEYGAAIALDVSGDLASPGPGDFGPTQWTDLTALYAYNTLNTLWVYVDLPAYSGTSVGQFGLTIDVNGTAVGGSSDPWLNAITFAQSALPDFCIRGDIKTIPADGWTELRTWNGSSWSGGGTDWGGLSGVDGLVGTKVAYANGNGLELMIPLTDIGASPGNILGLEMFTTQSSGTKGAFDTVPNDDQSSDWYVATTEHNDVPFTLVPEPASATLMVIGGMVIASRRLRRKTRASSHSGC
jgi:hypothetical protein